jgi:hypothetical protein
MTKKKTGPRDNPDESKRCIELARELADVLRRINDHPVFRLYELLPWSSRARPATLAA